MVDRKHKPFALGDDPSTWKVSQLTAYLKGHKVASSGIKRTIIQRVIDHKAGLLRTRVVGEKRPREESGGVIEDGDVEAGSSADQGRGSEEGDTAGGGGGEGDVVQMTKNHSRAP